MTRITLNFSNGNCVFMLFTKWFNRLLQSPRYFLIRNKKKKKTQRMKHMKCRAIVLYFCVNPIGNTNAWIQHKTSLRIDIQNMKAPVWSGCFRNENNNKKWLNLIFALCLHFHFQLQTKFSPFIRTKFSWNIK